VVRAVVDGAEVIGLIDGYFEWTLSVWHKEILWALTQGVHVFGAASMGALRAVELERYGMRGVGEIFRAYRDGELEDDDEVAVLHVPGQTFARSSEAMVNIRATFAAAAASGVIAEGTCELLVALAKQLFYPDRSYDRVVQLGGEAGVSRAELDRLSGWLPDHRLDRKRADAIAMLCAIRAWLGADAPPRFEPRFELPNTVHLTALLGRVVPEHEPT
jgi:hypothetical protein